MHFNSFLLLSQARELAEDPDLFIENFAVIKPQVVQEAMDLISKFPFSSNLKTAIISI